MSEEQKNTEAPLTPDELSMVRNALLREAATEDQIARTLAQITQSPAKEQPRVASALIESFRGGNDISLPAPTPASAPAAVIAGGERRPVQLAPQRDPAPPAPDADVTMSFLPKVPVADPNALNQVPIGQIDPRQATQARLANESASEAAQLDLGTLVGKQADQIAGLRESFEPDFQALEMERQIAQAEAIERQERALAQFESQLDNLLNTPMSSDRLFGSASGAAQFAAILGPAVGSLIQFNNNINFPGSNTPNTAARMINEAIERDVQSQRLQFQQAQAGLQGRQTVYNIARQLGLDEQQAMDATRVRLKEEVARRLGTMATVHAGQRQSMQLQQMARNFREQLLREKEGLVAAASNAQANALGAGRASSVREPITGYETIENTDIGVPFLELKTEERRKVRSGLQDARRAMRALQEIIQILDSGATLSESGGIGGSATITAAGSRLQQLAGVARLASKQEFALGAYDEGVRIALNEIFGGDPSRLAILSEGETRRNSRVRMQGLLDDLRVRTSTFAQDFQLRPTFGTPFQATARGELLERAAEPQVRNPAPSTPGREGTVTSGVAGFANR